MQQLLRLFQPKLSKRKMFGGVQNNNSPAPVIPVRLVRLSRRWIRKRTNVARRTLPSRQILIRVAHVSNHQKQRRVVFHDVVKRRGRVVREPDVAHNCDACRVRGRARQRQRCEAVRLAENVGGRVSTFEIIGRVRQQTCKTTKTPVILIRHRL